MNVLLPCFQRWCALPPPSTWTLHAPVSIQRSASQLRTASRLPRERLQEKSGAVHTVDQHWWDNSRWWVVRWPWRACDSSSLPLQSCYDKGLRTRLGDLGSLWAPPCLRGKRRADRTEGGSVFWLYFLSSRSVCFLRVHVKDIVLEQNRQLFALLW